MDRNHLLRIGDFINEIKYRPCLWQSNHPDFGNKSITEQNWKEIGEMLGCSAFRAHSKWKCLRESFRREIRRATVELRGRQPEDYKSSWKHYTKLFFLKEEIVNAQTTVEPNKSAHSVTIFYLKNEPVEISETTHDAFLKEFHQLYSSRVNCFGDNLPSPEQTTDKEKRLENCEDSSRDDSSTDTCPEGGEEEVEVEDEEPLEEIMSVTDPDLGYLASLVPHLRNVPHSKKDEIRKRIETIILSFR